MPEGKKKSYLMQSPEATADWGWCLCVHASQVKHNPDSGVCCLCAAPEYCILASSSLWEQWKSGRAAASLELVEYTERGSQTKVITDSLTPSAQTLTSSREQGPWCPSTLRHHGTVIP